MPRKDGQPDMRSARETRMKIRESMKKVWAGKKGAESAGEVRGTDCNPKGLLSSKQTTNPAPANPSMLEKYVGIRDAAEKQTEEIAKGLPPVIQKLLDKNLGYYDIMEMDITGKDLENFMLCSRFKGIADFLSLQLLQDLKTAEQRGFEKAIALSFKGKKMRFAKAISDMAEQRAVELTKKECERSTTSLLAAARKDSYEKGRLKAIADNVKDNAAAYEQGRKSRYGKCAHCVKNGNLIGLCSRCTAELRQQGRSEMADEIEKKLKGKLHTDWECGGQHVTRERMLEAIAAARKRGKHGKV